MQITLDYVHGRLNALRKQRDDARHLASACDGAIEVLEQAAAVLQSPEAADLTPINQMPEQSPEEQMDKGIAEVENAVSG